MGKMVKVNKSSPAMCRKSGEVVNSDFGFIRIVPVRVVFHRRLGRVLNAS